MLSMRDLKPQDLQGLSQEAITALAAQMLGHIEQQARDLEVQHKLLLRKDRDIGEIQRQNFKKALKAGVKMIYGTDAGVYPHGDNAKQFAVMVRYGATPLQAIQAATLTAAEALGQTKDVGQVAVGRYGDIIAVAGDPLLDVTVLEKPVFVMKGGAVVKQP